MEDPVGVCIQSNVRWVAKPHAREVVFIYVAHDPDARQVGDGERTGSVKRLDAGGNRHFLIGNRSGDWGVDVHHKRGFVGIVAQQAQVLGHGLEIDLGFILGVLRYLKVGLRDCTVLVQIS